MPQFVVKADEVWSSVTGRVYVAGDLVSDREVLASALEDHVVLRHTNEGDKLEHARRGAAA